MYNFQLEPIGNLKSTEHIDHQAAHCLADTIRLVGFWTAPVPVESLNGYVMDGNHRLQAARILGLERIPVVKLDYQDARVSVSRWLDGTPFCLNELVGVLASNKLLPYKTTKHTFTPELPAIKVPLGSLRK